MLRQRLITGPLLIVALLGLMWLDVRLDAWLADRSTTEAAPRGVILSVLAALVVAPLAAIELAALLRAGGRSPAALVALGAVLGTIAGATTLLGVESPLPIGAPLAVPAALLVLAALAFVVAGWGRRLDAVGSVVGAALMGFVVLGLPLAFFVALRHEYSAALLVGVILTAKSCDIGAYFTGRTLGRRKLIAWLSPGKTWEGLVGGIATAAAVGGLLAWWFPGHTIPVVAGVVGGAALGVAGQAGDLAESLLKRCANAKDSGNTLPGMGGILDVIDSLLPAGPIAMLVLAVFSKTG